LAKTQKKGSSKYWTRKDVRSGLEERVRHDLDRRGIPYGYETIKLKYVKKTCPGCGEVVDSGTYTPDFIFERAPRVRLVVEAKGRFTSSDRTKMLAVRMSNPGEDIRFLFQRDQCLRKGSTTRYSGWAVKHGFPYHIGEVIPDEWLN